MKIKSSEKLHLIHSSNFDELDCNSCFYLFSDHEKNSHGVPGLYFKYDVAALKVIVRQDRDNMVKFLVRLCSIIAGIIVISGKLTSKTQSKQFS